MRDPKPFILRPEQTLKEAMLCIDKNTEGLALVLDSKDHLLYTITDGDLRRAILHGLSLDLSIKEWALKHPEQGNRRPVTAPATTSSAELLNLMQAKVLRHIPLVDEKGRLVGVSLLNDLVQEEELKIQAVVMAGGMGKRLYPLTKDLPKPMLPVGDKPLLEWIIGHLQKSGIRHVNLTTNYKKDLITQHFGNGENFGVDIQYVEENQPLGTAGSLSLLKKTNEPLLVINGDILTRVDFRSLHDFHQEHNADMTVAVHQQEMHVPYGVVHTEGAFITGISEKPQIKHFINAGIYLLSPEIFSYLPSKESQEFFNMTDLIAKLIHSKKRVISFPIREYWLDVGLHDQYHKAQEDMKNGNFVSKK